MSDQFTKVLPIILGFLISAGLIGFAITIYNNDHSTALGIIGVVGGHWLGVGSIATGKTLSDLTSNVSSEMAKAISSAVNPTNSGTASQ